MALERCGICGRPVAVTDDKPGALIDKRRRPDGKIRCYRHIGMDKVVRKPDTVKGLYGVVDLPPSQSRFDDADPTRVEQT